MDQTTPQQFAEQIDPFLLIAALASRDAAGGLLEEAQHYAMRGFARTADDMPVEIRQKAVARVLADIAAGSATPLPQGHPRWRQIVDFATGVQVPDEYFDMLIEESGLGARRDYRDQPVQRAGTPPKVAIIGAGLSGIGLGVYLKRAGIPFVIYEQNPAPGGTWYDNRYPGCGVDTTSHLYSYSFALNPKWSRYFCKQQELLSYIDRCIADFDLRPHIVYEATVRGASFDSNSKCWRLAMTIGGQQVNLSVDVVVSAVGQLNVPAIPDLKGLKAFKGPVVHTAQWPAGLDLSGQRVAMIGSGASAVQVGPTIAPNVDRLLAFQRSPQWLSSRPLYHQPVRPADRWAYENVGLFLNWYRLTLYWHFGDRLYPVLMLADGPNGPQPSPQSNDLRQMFTAYIRDRLADRPDLLAKVIPDYPPMAKRIPIDFGWYDMLKRDNVDLITSAIDHIDDGAVVTTDGARHPVDAIVLATGFEATRMIQKIPVRGKNGKELQSIWNGDDPRAYLGLMVPDFPNFFIMYGPNTNLGHGGSLIFQIECQARYVAAAVRHLAESGAHTLEVRGTVFDAYNAQLDQLLERTVWGLPGVNNWFKNSRGRIATNSPWRLVDYWRLTRSFNPDDCLIA